MSTAPTESSIDSDERDGRLLNATKDLCLRLEIADLNPAKVVWSKMDPRFQTQKIPLDEPLVLPDQVVIHEELRRILEEDELTALIAYALVRERKPKSRKARLVALFGICAFAAIPLEFIFFPILFSQPYLYCYYSVSCTYHPVGYLVAFILLYPLIFTIVGLSRLYSRRVTLEADRTVGVMLGKEALLSALKTIQSSVKPVNQKTTPAKYNYNRNLKTVKTRIRLLEKLRLTAITQ